MSEALEFAAIVYKVQTLVDNGIRLTLDLPESAITEAAQLMELKRLGVAFEVQITPLRNLINTMEQNYGGQVATRGKRQSERTTA